MRKLFLLITLLGVLTTVSKAQYGPVTHANGNAMYPGPNGNMNVNIQRFNVASPLQYPCNTGPYFIGGGRPEAYQFNFTTRPATIVKLSFADMNVNDEVEIRINGLPYTLTPANLSDNIICPGGSPHTGAITPGGNLTSTTGNPIALTGAVTVTIDNGPGVINSLRVSHVFSNPTAGGVSFRLEFNVDTCAQDLIVREVQTPADPVSDGKVCQFSDLKLYATPFPNTVFNWTGPLGWTATGSSPTRANMLPTYAGRYYCTATRGVAPNQCIYKDSIDIIVNNTPVKPFLTASNSPLCKGDSLYLVAATTGAVGVTWYWDGPGGYSASGTGSTANTVGIPGFQPFNVGIYRAWAITTDGCVSDTGKFPVAQNPEVKANYTWSKGEGCGVDTIYINNNSSGHDSSEWILETIINGDTVRSYIGSDNSPSWKFLRPYNMKDTIPDSFMIRLIARKNMGCVDSFRNFIETDHPLYVAFDASDTAICQGATTIDFTNTTHPSGDNWTHSFFWDFRDGSPEEKVYSTSHLYTKAGIYKARLKDTMRRNDLILDPTHLGCIDSIEQTIIVDSTGEISFIVSDTSICAGKTINFAGEYSRLGSRAVAWDMGDGNIIGDKSEMSYSYDKAGEYAVTFQLFNNICPNAVATREITVKPFPKVELGEDTVICPNGEPVIIRDHIAQGPDVTYLWNVKTQDKTAELLVRGPGVYSLTADYKGCSTTDSITVFKDCYVDIPNVFSPDGDGNNDYFLPRQYLSKSVSSFKMMVFDRWGKQVFETTSITGRGWDGKFNGELQPMGVYIYTIEVHFANKTNERYQGNVTLLR
jgi:hypothetical protein